MDLSRSHDPIYRDLRLWSLRGLIPPLPAFRPYPLSLVRDRLLKVLQSEGPLDRARAELYLRAIDEEFRGGFLAVHHSLFTVGYPNHDYDGTTGGFLRTNAFLVPGVALSGHAGAVAQDWAANTAFPVGQRRLFDFLLDDSSVEIFQRNYLLSLSIGGVFSFGDENLYAQVGLSRHGFGPFPEGMVISPQAPAAPTFSFTWIYGPLIYSKYLLGLSATRDNKSTVITNGQEFFPNKYLTGQSFQLMLFDGILTVGLFETVVFGQRLDPLYLLPVVSSLYGSIYTGMWDNILVGGNLVLRLPWGFAFLGEFHADDLSFLRLLRLRFDGKTKIAAQAGLNWQSPGWALEGLELRYALVTPYTFTHVREFITGGASDQLPINYKNYTHQGQGLVTLEPNSDRLELIARLVPNHLLNFTLTGRRLRHGNASEDGYTAVSQEYIGTTDGSFNDNGYVTPGGPHKFDENRFLNQAVIEELYQIGFDYQLLVDTPLGFMNFSGGYLFEYGINRRGSPVTGSIGNASFTNRGTPQAGSNGVRHYVTFRIAFER